MYRFYNSNSNGNTISSLISTIGRILSQKGGHTTVTVTEIPPPLNGTETDVRGIMSSFSGDIIAVGVTDFPNLTTGSKELTAFRFSEATGRLDLLAFGRFSIPNYPQFSTQSEALAINSNGIIVGSFAAFYVGSRAFAWDGGSKLDLFPLETVGTRMLFSEAKAINNQGIVVGHCDRVAFQRREAFKWDLNTGQLTHLGVMPGAPANAESEALAVNDQGVVYGVSDFSDPITGATVKRAFRWEGPNKLWELGTLLVTPTTSPIFFGNSRAVGFGGQNMVIGSSDSLSGDIVPIPVNRAFVIEENLFQPLKNWIRLDLGTLSPTIGTPFHDLGQSEAFAISRDGWIVGTADTGPNANLLGPTAFIRDPTTGLMSDLNNPQLPGNWFLEEPTGVIDAGTGVLPIVCGRGRQIGLPNAPLRGLIIHLS